jgi:hypothetical protein
MILVTGPIFKHHSSCDIAPASYGRTVHHDEEPKRASKEENVFLLSAAFYVTTF